MRWKGCLELTRNTLIESVQVRWVSLYEYLGANGRSILAIVGIYINSLRSYMYRQTGNVAVLSFDLGWVDPTFISSINTE